MDRHTLEIVLKLKHYLETRGFFSSSFVELLFVFLFGSDSRSMVMQYNGISIAVGL